MFDAISRMNLPQNECHIKLEELTKNLKTCITEKEVLVKGFNERELALKKSNQDLALSQAKLNKWNLDLEKAKDALRLKESELEKSKDALRLKESELEKSNDTLRIKESELEKSNREIAQLQKEWVVGTYTIFCARGSSFGASKKCSASIDELWKQLEGETSFYEEPFEKTTHFFRDGKAKETTRPIFRKH
eukprot:TRINITY_DN2617_c1_g1_i1.p1 TRINITY_DN2617_c1_g1~~TRINITY_DN2617_c1_g1_i1.p1  ORF type:complete len:191 (-),score=38.11 TRINITY_DN2617_c1_g1_i1:17-589(-)